MDIRTIMQLTNAECVYGDIDSDFEVTHGFACDLMSDVLTLDSEKLLLITGLCNNQTIRTADVADVKCILFVRDKEVTADMIELAEEDSIILLRTEYSMFRAVSELAKGGIKPLF